MEQEQFKKEILPLREKLFLYARRLLDNPEDAEDVMQEVFFEAVVYAWRVGLL